MERMTALSGRPMTKDFVPVRTDYVLAGTDYSKLSFDYKISSHREEKITAQTTILTNSLDMSQKMTISFAGSIPNELYDKIKNGGIFIRVQDFLVATGT